MGLPRDRRKKNENIWKVNLKPVDASKIGGNQKPLEAWVVHQSSPCFEVLVVRIFVVGKKVPTTKHMDPSLSKEKHWILKARGASYPFKKWFHARKPNGFWKR